MIVMGLGLATVDGCAAPQAKKSKPSCPQRRAVNKHRW
jgi:hypothetical protein